MYLSNQFSHDQLLSIPSSVFQPAHAEVDTLLQALTHSVEQDIGSYYKNGYTDSVKIMLALLKPDAIINFLQWYFSNLEPSMIDAMALDAALSYEEHHQIGRIQDLLKKDFCFAGEGATQVEEQQQHPLTEEEYQMVWSFLIEKAPHYVSGMAIISNALTTYAEAVRIHVVDRYIIEMMGVESPSKEQIEGFKSPRTTQYLKLQSWRMGNELDKFDMADIESILNDSDEYIAKKIAATNLRAEHQAVAVNISEDSVVFQYLPFIMLASARSVSGITEHSLRKGVRDSFVNADVFHGFRWELDKWQDPKFESSVISSQPVLPVLSQCPFKKIIGFLMSTGFEFKDDGTELLVKRNHANGALLQFTASLCINYQESIKSPASLPTNQYPYRGLRR